MKKQVSVTLGIRRMVKLAVVAMVLCGLVTVFTLPRLWGQDGMVSLAERFDFSANGVTSSTLNVLQLSWFLMDVVGKNLPAAGGSRQPRFASRKPPFTMPEWFWTVLLSVLLVFLLASDSGMIAGQIEDGLRPKHFCVGMFSATIGLKESFGTENA